MKKTIFLLIGLSLVFILNNGYCEAQSFGLYGAVALPQGDFGDDSGSDAGLAKTGFGGGMEYCAPLGSPGLEWVLSGSLLLNKLDTDPLEDELGWWLDGGDVDAGSWMNIPLMGGIRYRTMASPTVDFFAVGLAGLNVVKGPTIKYEALFWDDWEYEYVHVEIEQTLDPATSFGMGIGAGIIVNKKLSIAFRYLNLGEPEIKGDIEADVEYEEYFDWDVEFDQPISMLLLTVGVTF